MTGKPTPAWDSGNNTIWENYTDIAFIVANSLILLITSAMGIGANLFVILAVLYQKSLQTLNNVLVVNLAVTDILKCVVDCPILLTIVTTVYQRGYVDELICDTQVAFFSFSCCNQLLTMACISEERYQAIAQPSKTSQRRRRIMVLLPLTWALAILVAVFCVIFVKDSPVYEKCKGLSRATSSSYDTFGLYMLFPLWAFCLSVIIGFYARIFILVRSHNRKIFDRGTFPVSKTDKTTHKQKIEETPAVENGHGKSEQNQSLSKSVAQVEQAEPNSSKKDSMAALLASTKAPQCASISLENKKEVKNTLEITDLETEHHPPAMQAAVRTEEKPFKTEQSNPCDTNIEANRDAAASVQSSTTKPQVSSNFDTEKRSKERVQIDKTPSEMKETSSHVPSSAQLENKESTPVLLIECKQAENRNGGEKLSVDQVFSLPPVLSNVPETAATENNLEIEGAVCMMPSKASKERAKKNKESKMAKRAGYIIITFILFWLPLITTILSSSMFSNTFSFSMFFFQITIIWDIEILSVSITCITSLSDPIIYAAVNPQFRTEFYTLKNKFLSIFKKEL
ncbi:octopamine receptor 2-like [Etheostoma spectabile]|uniref:octopamine receptor 2-like n=1 Tax=Etheostoma spectabile TaxID=54343 RepID=UPI0013AEFE19|nr:octopamine receptor 2-like [Etheostoma spectabile]